MNMTLKSSFLGKTVGTLFLLGLLVSSTLQACGKGCSMCYEDVENGTTSCKICDLFSSYIKSFDGSCELKEIENCEVASLNHFTSPCLQCKPNYVLDIVQGKCVSVNISKVVPDCYRYSSLSTCLSCNPDHFISIGKCIKSETLVADCLNYSSDGICSNCVTDRFLDKDKNECREFPQSTGCLNYNTLRCDQCKPGYAQDLNFYLRISPTDSGVQSLALNQANSTQILQSHDENCFPLNVPNCAVHETADRCLNCDSGYFVGEDRQCHEFPRNRINNCMIYSDETTCQECEFLFKEVGGKCESRTLKSNCIKYNTSTDDCVECASNYKVSSGNCFVRGAPPSDCKMIKLNSDLCQECNEGFVLDNFSQCFPEIPNCKTHGTDTSNTSTHKKCTACKENYFMKSDTECLLRLHQPNCVLVNPAENECQTCASGYYNNSGQCKAYTVDFCNQVDPNKNECNDCVEGFKFDSDSGSCKIVELNNCIKPLASDETKCEICVAGFYKDSNHKCRMRNLVGCETPKANENKCQNACIAGYDYDSTSELCVQKLIPNCVTEANGICSDCGSKHFINEYGTCSKIVKNLGNCSDSTSQTLCSTCNDLDNHYLEPVSRYCLARLNKTNCATYENDRDHCASCTSGFYLLEGYCHPISVTCKTTPTNVNYCVDCAAGFYLNPITKTCLKNNVQNCQPNDDTHKFGCKTCNTGYYLNLKTKLCEKGNIPYCTAYEANDSVCTTCHSTTYKFEGKCIKPFSLGCRKLKTTLTDEKVCDECLKGFYLDDGECKIANIPNCKVFNNTTKNCTTCHEGYYPDGTNVNCLEQNILNCETYTANLNECSKCDSLYMINGTKKCDKISATNCVFSNGDINDYCLTCASGYRLYKTNDSKIICETLYSTLIEPIENCRGNGSYDDVSCSKCNDNFELMYLMKAVARMPPNCVLLSNSNPFLCGQCAEYYEFDSSNPGLCKKPSSPPTDCIQARAYFNVSLSGATAKSLCDKCKIDTHYNNGGACATRNPFFNCIEYDPIADSCLTCKYPNSKIAQFVGDVECKTATLTPITNCSLYNNATPATADCLLCKTGFTGNDCSTPINYDFPDKFYGTDLSGLTQLTDYDKVTLASNGSTYVLVGKVVKNTHVLKFNGTNLKTSLNYVKNKYEFGVAFEGSPISFSLSSLPTWIDSNPISDCKIFFHFTNLYCLACKDGKLGRSKYSNTLAIDYLSDCVDPASYNLESNYTGLGYLTHDILTGKAEFPATHFSFGHYINFDSCSNGNIPIAYLVRGNTDYFASTIYGYKKTVMECIPKIHEERLVDNCQVYGYLGDNTSKPDFANDNDKNTVCLACKPGYQGSDFVNEIEIAPGKCTKIENCNLNSVKNTKMNSCGECNVGYAWEINYSTLNVLFHKCIVAPDFCKVYNKTTQTCKLCKSDYGLNTNRECVPKADLGCSTMGYQKVDFIGRDLSTYANNNIRLLGLMNLHFLSVEIAGGNDNEFCETCASSGSTFPMRKATASVNNSCSYIELTEYNCKNFKASTNGNECYECNDDYILNLSDSKCYSSSDYDDLDNCKKSDTNSLNENKCLICKEGSYYFSVSGKCKEDEYCTSTNDYNQCADCAEGYYLDFDTKMCTAIPTGSECAKFNNYASGLINSICVECTDKTLIPINYKDNENYSFKCQVNTISNSSIFNAFVTAFDLTCAGSLPPYSVTFNDSVVGSTLNVNPYITHDRICMSKSSEKNNCLVYDWAADECTKCFEGFFLDSNKSCILGTVINCLEYSNNITCSKCKSGYFLAKNEVIDQRNPHTLLCKEYTAQCDKYLPNQDGCETCAPYMYQDSSDYSCKVYTVVGCLVYQLNTDDCLICSPGYYLDDSNKCLQIKMENCAVYSRQTDTCQSCQEGFYLSVAQTCLPHSKINCKIYSLFKDACEVCQDGYYLDETGTCMETILIGCEVPKPNANRCSSCATGFWLDIADSICKPHTVLHCSLFNKLENKCLTCDKSSYMGTDRLCTEYSAATGCENYNANEDKCTTCLEGRYMDTDNICKIYTKTTCKTFNKTKDECTSCSESYYLDVQNGFNCKEITAQNCVKFSVSENRCSLCSESDYLDLNTGSCMSYTMQNCEQLHPYKDQCSTCQEGHFLNSTFNCVEYSAPGCSSFSFSSDACVACQNGFYLKVSTLECVSYTAKNCVSFQLQANKCSSCLPGFYLSNGSCLPYSVGNCAKNDLTADRCIGCIPGHYFSGGNCPEYTVPNCKDFESDQNKCSNCLPGFYFEFGRCFEYTAKNCLSFNPEKDLCDQCDNSSLRIYRNSENNFCEEVTEIENCSVYSTTKDECLQCELEFFLKDQSCHSNPSGIPMCEIYTDEDECGLCEPGSYLSNNVCVVPPVLINGCQRYSSDKYCEECGSGFALSPSFQCDPTTETSCSTYADATNCASCSGNKILAQNTLNNTVCVDSGISYCDEAVNSSGNVMCNRCSQGYFLNESQIECLWPETLVEHCLEYTGHGICSRCKDNYLLSKDNSQCSTDIATVGSQCLVGHVSDKPKCSRCEGGYYFDDSGICQKCSENIDGCDTCDINNLSRCLICKKGFFMNESFMCEEYPPVVVEPIGIEIIRYAFIAVLAFALMIK